MDPDPEVKLFEGIWEGGYFEGNPLDPHGRSNYSYQDLGRGFPDRPQNIVSKETGFISTLYATYLLTIRKQLPCDATVLEIGPGRGAWTKAILSQRPRRVYALDALSAEHNRFWEYVGNTDVVQYFQVQDFTCSHVPENSIDFFFSFGVFCHISRRGTEAYFTAISQKMKPSATGFCMISDYQKLVTVDGRTISTGEAEAEDQNPKPGRWYHLGTDWFCGMLESKSFEILDRDIEVSVRDPIVKFRRR